MNSPKFSDDLNLFDLVYFRNHKDPRIIHDFSQKSQKWRSLYRYFEKATNETLVWYKDKELKSSAPANTIDMLSYYQPLNFSNVLIFITGTESTWSKMYVDCEQNCKTHNVVQLNDVRVSYFEMKDVMIILAALPKSYSVTIMSIDDYKNGLRIQ